MRAHVSIGDANYVFGPLLVRWTLAKKKVLVAPVFFFPLLHRVFKTQIHYVGQRIAENRELPSLPLSPGSTATLRQSALTGGGTLSQCTIFITAHIRLPDIPRVLSFPPKLSYCVFRVEAHDCTYFTPEINVCLG